MASRRAQIFLAVLATALVVAGGLGYRYFLAMRLEGAPRAQTASSVKALPGGLAAPFLQGLRGRIAEVEPPPTESVVVAEKQQVIETPPAPEGVVEIPEIAAPQPPRRPAGLAAALEEVQPFPPRRPADLAALVETPPTAAGTPGGAEGQPGLTEEEQPLVPAPRPPSRPRRLPAVATATPTPAPAPVAAPTPAPGPQALKEAQPGAAEEETLVAAPQPPLRPRNLAVATTTPAPVVAPAQAPTPAPQPEGSGQQLAALTEPALRPAPEGSFDKPATPARFNMGAPAYVRIFKKESELELWLKVNGRFTLYRTYAICKWSGRLGPKTKESDYQSPEGFYSVSQRMLNPHSNYHLAFNVGYPNAFDKQNGRTGGLVMVHGNCKSVGCFAMTDKGVDEIYGFVSAALARGQREVPVHIFPFRMTESAIAQEIGGGGGFLSFLATDNGGRQWAGFWRNLKEGYDIFQQTGEPPTAYACGDHYAFGAKGGCTRIAGW